MNINIQKKLQQIKTICKQRHVHLTPQRLAILKLILQCNRAITAYDLLSLSHKSILPQAKPSTIYRALNFLLTQGFIHRIESTNSFMLCHYFFELSHNFVFFICKRCKQVTEQTTTDIEKILKNMAKIEGFTMYNNIIEAQGLCFKCIHHTSIPSPL